MLDMKRIEVDEFERIMEQMKGKVISISFMKDGICDGAYSYENFGFHKGLVEDWYYGDQDDLILEHRLLLSDIQDIKTFEGADFEEQIKIDLMNGRTYIFQHE